MSPIIFRLKPEEVTDVYSSEYWNDITKEKNKNWWIESTNDRDRLQKFLSDSGLLTELDQVYFILDRISRDGLKIADLACGSGWASALLAMRDDVAEVHSVEISKHRLSELMPLSVSCLASDPVKVGNKIQRYLSSFYETGFENKKFDVVFLSHAFHHASDPKALLVECGRIMKDDGICIIAGEHTISLWWIIKKLLKRTFIEMRFSLKFTDLFQPDPVTGDHFYRTADYVEMFQGVNLQILSRHKINGRSLFVLSKNGFH